jgi:DNA-binding SARP family transcriptional activator
VAELHIDLLGGMRLRTAAGRDIRIASRKAQALLGFLALEPGHACSRDTLAGLLWEDSDPELARASLRQALASLRRSLPEPGASALRGDGGTVMLDPAVVTSDVAQFHALLRDGSPGALARAVESHTGVLLDGLDARSAAFEHWLLEKRGELRRLLLAAAERVAVQCASAGDHAGAIAALERLVAIEPSNERAQRDLMEAYARQGRYTDALRQYRACREALRRDLDVAPEPATDTLHRELLRRRRSAAPDMPEADADPDSQATGSASARAPRTDLSLSSAEPQPTSGAGGPKIDLSPFSLREAVVLVARIGEAAAPSVDDPESARDVIAAVHARISAVVGRHGGRVDRPNEGEAVAAFGLDSLTGHEVEHAVRAALELAATGVTQPAGCPRLAVGIAQGQVLPASDSQPFPLSGRPVAQARELARGAAAGEVATAAEVATQVADRYTLAPSSTGLPAGAQRVARVRSTGARSPGRFFAGRRAELALLLTLLERVAATRRGRAVILRGDAGIGKSSLLDALATAAPERGALAYGVQVLDFGQAAHERPGPALAGCLLGISAEADDGARNAAVDRAVAAGQLAEGDELLARDLIGTTSQDGAASLLSAMDVATRERGRARVLNRLMQGAAERTPLLIVIEDVHWADAVEVSQLADLAAAAATLPVLLALSTRADGDPTGPAWRARARGCPVTMLDLAPLADDEARELAARYTGLPAEVVEECLEKAAGHPLFLDQLLRTAQSGQTSLPGSVRGLLLARIGRLPAELQRGLHAAAVLGTRFSRGALRHVLAEPRYDTRRLEDAGLIATDGDECRFSHSVIRAAVYESLLRSTRRELHRRSAAWFEGRDSGLEADHLAAADDPAAPAAYLRAATEEHRASRLDRALAHAQRSRDLARAAPDLCAAFAKIGDVCLARGRTDDAIAAFRESVDLASSSGERARGWLGLAGSLRIVDRYDEALGALDHAEQAAAAESDPRMLARLWTLRGNLHFPRGELDDCLGAHRRALAFAEQAASPEDIVRARGGLADAQYQRGRMRTALAEFSRCVELCEQHGYASLRLSYLPMVAVTQLYMGDFSSALDVSSRCAAAAAHAGDLRAQLLSVDIRASVELNRARYADALVATERGVSIAREIGARRFEAEGLILHGLALLGLGDRQQAHATLSRGATLTREAARTYCGPWALASLAMATDDPARCRALLDEGERWLADGCVSHNYLEFYRLAAAVGQRLGDWDASLRYADALEAYTRAEPLPWAELVISSSRALARAGRSETDTHVRADIAAARDMARSMQFYEVESRLAAWCR